VAGKKRPRRADGAAPLGRGVSPALEAAAAPWEGPFADPNERLPQAPEVAAQRRAARQRWRERQRACKAAKLAAERDDAAGDDIAA
jgi:hypothetical protein